MSVRLCPECGKVVSDSRVDCVHCGHIFNEKRCPDCREFVNKNDAFCNNCGYIFKSNINNNNFNDSLKSINTDEIFLKSNLNEETFEEEDNSIKKQDVNKKSMSENLEFNNDDIALIKKFINVIPNLISLMDYYGEKKKINGEFQNEKNRIEAELNEKIEEKNRVEIELNKKIDLKNKLEMALNEKTLGMTNKLKDEIKEENQMFGDLKKGYNVKRDLLEKMFDIINGKYGINTKNIKNSKIEVLEKMISDIDKLLPSGPCLIKKNKKKYCVEIKEIGVKASGSSELTAIRNFVASFFGVARVNLLISI